jgi:hypothetical protein
MVSRSIIGTSDGGVTWALRYGPDSEGAGS